MKKWLFALVFIALVAVVVIVFVVREKPTPKTEPEVPNPLIGLITEASKQTVTIKTNDGQSATFANQVEGVSVEHLKEHQADKEPVSITWYAEGDQKIATKIDDAP